MSVVVMIDGHIRAPGEQAISVFDRGFLYGDSVFETLRTYGGVPFALDEHMSRLARSAGLVFIELPVPQRALAAEVNAAIRESGNAESYVRVMVTRGQGMLGLDPALAERPRRVIIVQPLRVPAERHYRDGATAVSFRTRRQIDATDAAGAKVGNYLVSVLAMRAASRAGAVEALITDGAGQVLEGASSNVFLAKSGALITAPVEAGILAGITRSHVLRVAEQLDIEVALRAADLEEAYAADELFITSSIRELMPIVRLDDRLIGTGAPGKVYRRLHAAFRRSVWPNGAQGASGADAASETSPAAAGAAASPSPGSPSPGSAG